MTNKNNPHSNSNSKYCLILTTCNNKKTKQNIINKLLTESKLSACIQTKEIESHYLWNNQIQNDKEYLITIKTTKNLYNKIEQKIKEVHDYEIPQIIMVAIEDGNKQYLDWIDQQIKI